MPTPEIGLQLRFEPPQAESASFWSRIGSDGEQMSAQYLLDVVASWRAHCGAAVTPAGTSVGHFVLKIPVQAGEQTAPPTPWIWIACSSLMHAPACGSP